VFSEATVKRKSDVTESPKPAKKKKTKANEIKNPKASKVKKQSEY